MFKNLVFLYNKCENVWGYLILSYFLSNFVSVDVFCIKKYFDNVFLNTLKHHSVIKLYNEFKHFTQAESDWRWVFSFPLLKNSSLKVENDVC